MSPDPTPQPVRVLLVDDDPGDVRLTLEALKESKLHTQIDIAHNGIEALAMLRREGPYAGAARPDVILLDLNMPIKDGRETLADIKSDPELDTIPVVVLTTSRADQDIAQSYTLGASCYVSKPVDLEQFVKVVKTIEDFWFTIVRLPK